MYLCEHHFNKAECMFDARVTCNVFSIILSEQHIHCMLLQQKISYTIYNIYLIFTSHVRLLQSVKSGH